MYFSLFFLFPPVFYQSLKALASHFPFRMAPLKKAGICTEDGFVSLQQKLLDRKEIKCSPCLQLLQTHGYKCSNHFQELKLEVPADQPQERGQDPEPDKAPGDDEKPQKETYEEKRERRRREFNNDPWALVRSHAPTITLLPPGSFRRAHPFRCSACKTRRAPDGKVGDLCQATFNAVHWFLYQHLDCDSHQKKVANLAGKLGARAAPLEVVDCSGLCVSDLMMGGKVYNFKEEFNIWLSMNKPNTHLATTHHKYWFDKDLDSWFARSKNCKLRCEKLPEQDSAMCTECEKLGSAKSIVRHAQRFSYKYYLAHLLTTRIFHDEQDAEAALSKLKGSALYHTSWKNKLDIAIDLDLPALQQIVRASFLSTNDRVRSQLKTWLMMIDGDWCFGMFGILRRQLQAWNAESSFIYFQRLCKPRFMVTQFRRVRCYDWRLRVRWCVVCPQWCVVCVRFWCMCVRLCGVCVRLCGLCARCMCTGVSCVRAVGRYVRAVLRSMCAVCMV